MSLNFTGNNCVRSIKNMWQYCNQQIKIVAVQMVHYQPTYQGFCVAKRVILFRLNCCLVSVKSPLMAFASGSINIKRTIGDGLTEDGCLQ